MRLLGICPNCGQRDGIEGVWKKGMRWDPNLLKQVRCEYCNKIWESYWDLIDGEREKGNRLIPVEIHSTEWCREMFHPHKEEIPWRNLIVTVLNAALLTRFKLRVSFATEGGVCCPEFEFRNCDDRLGLYLSGGSVESRPVKAQRKIARAFNFYEEMLKFLFMEGFKISFPYNRGILEKEYSAGKILWLSEHEQNYRQALEILIAVLIKVKSRNFAFRVIKSIEAVKRNPFSSSYLTGLSAKEIAELFVPPPPGISTTRKRI